MLFDKSILRLGLRETEDLIAIAPAPELLEELYTLKPFQNIAPRPDLARQLQ